MRKLLCTQLVAGLAGGALVAVVLLIAGVGGRNHTTTVLQQAPLGAASVSSGAALTPRQIYQLDAPGVVFIRSEIVQQTQSPFSLVPQSQPGEATGSGFVIDRSGRILTNSHVINGATKITVQFGDQQLVTAKVIGKDLNSDLALLQVPTAGLNLHPLPLGDSSTVAVGDPAVAIGNPFGLDRTLTTGIVSALQRQIRAPNNFAIDNVIQTDAPINPGNSGGPLIDVTGKVIGVNSQIETGGGNGSVGIGFAVPINTAKKVIPQLETTGHVYEAYLGLTSLTIDPALTALNLPVSRGALVENVPSGSPASRAGIKGGDVSATISGQQIELGGDIILSVDGKSVTTSDDLSTVIGNHKPGDTVTLGILRSHHMISVKVKLGTRPNTVASTG